MNYLKPQDGTEGINVDDLLRLKEDVRKWRLKRKPREAPNDVRVRSTRSRGCSTSFDGQGLQLRLLLCLGVLIMVLVSILWVSRPPLESNNTGKHYEPWNSSLLRQVLRVNIGSLSRASIEPRFAKFHRRFGPVDWSHLSTR